MTARKQTRTAPKPTAAAAPTVEAATVAAIAKADWLTPADAGAQQLALKLARDLDKLGPDEAQSMASLARTFLNTLDRLGLTVTSRRDAATAVTEEADPLAQLRLRAEARLTDTAGGDTATVRSIARR